MDSYEATKTVFSRIQALDPENASKITGYVLIQEHGEQEMIRLAFGPDSLLHALILKAKAHLGISANTPSTPSTPSSPSPFSPISIPNRPSNPLSQHHHHHHHSPRVNSSFNLPSPLAVATSASNLNPHAPSPPSAAASWQHLSGFSPKAVTSPSYASVVNGGGSNLCVSSSSDSSSTNINNACASSSSFAQGGCGGGDPFDEYDLQDHLSFLNESSSTSKKLDLFDQMGSLPYGISNSSRWGSESINGGEAQNHHFHRRSLSLSDVGFGSDDSGSGFGWKPCLYFARGFCKNGSSCKFLHGGGYGDSVDSPAIGSPNKLAGMFDQCQEMLRSKAVAAQQQRLAAASHLMANASFPYSKCMNFLMSDSQRSAAAALMMGEEFNKFGRCRPERSDFSAMSLGGSMNAGSRQIYLTFPADSTFREEDVSNYFSIYGPVQDVRIPYQQKRMFGFVTFVYPETVKLILAKGNPHFVCDSRVLVKPYKEKGKVPDKKQQQQFERGDYSTCSSPSGVDREPYDLQLGARMFYNTQEILRRKLEEQADLQQAIELQGRRLMNLQFLDIKNNHHHHQHNSFHHNLSVGTPAPSPAQPRVQGCQILVLPSDRTNEDIGEENSSPPAASASPVAVVQQQEVNAASTNDCNSYGSSEESSNVGDCSLPKSNMEHILPDCLFASPNKSAGAKASLEEADHNGAACGASSNNDALLSPTSPLSMAAKSSCSIHNMPRFPSGNGAIEM